jgi:2-keto-4-pentenoate hydratase
MPTSTTDSKTLEHWTETIWSASRGALLDPATLADRLTLRDAESVQLQVLDHWRAVGDELAGWKVAATSGSGRDNFGPGIRPFGYIVRSRVFHSGDRVSFSTIRRPGLETELCFRMGSRLAGSGVTTSEAAEAVGSVAPAFEINEDRAGGTSTDDAVRVADNLKHWGIALGRERPVPQGIDWDAIESTMSLDGHVLERKVAKNHIDDHFQSIAALARELAQFGLGLEIGNVVITGSFTKQEVRGPGTFVGTFDKLGDVSLAFA